MDTKAVNHFLMNHNIYQKPESARYGLGRILGNGMCTIDIPLEISNVILGVLIVEGDKHKQQVKINDSSSQSLK